MSMLPAHWSHCFLGRGPQGVAESSAPETRAPGTPVYREPRHLASHALFFFQYLSYLSYLRIKVILDDNKCKILGLSTCLTLIDNESHQNFYPPPPPTLLTSSYSAFIPCASHAFCHLCPLAVCLQLNSSFKLKQPSSSTVPIM